MKKKILFVDDDINLLEALKRVLRKKSEDWETYFVKSGKEAVELMENIRFDIIVTDYKMPEMDGLELLSIVKERFQNIKSIILSGQSRTEIFDKAKEVADKYLDKPCESGTLITTLEELFGNNM